MENSKYLFQRTGEKKRKKNNSETTTKWNFFRVERERSCAKRTHIHTANDMYDVMCDYNFVIEKWKSQREVCVLATNHRLDWLMLFIRILSSTVCCTMGVIKLMAHIEQSLVSISMTPTVPLNDVSHMKKNKPKKNIRRRSYQLFAKENTFDWYVSTCSHKNGNWFLAKMRGKAPGKHDRRFCSFIFILSVDFYAVSSQHSLTIWLISYYTTIIAFFAP